jgi:hypothetical protein
MPFGTLLSYQGYTLKSRVEFTWARYFFMEDFDWKYEPVRFQRGRESYTPDFGLDGEELFTEIKAYGEKRLENKYHFCIKPLILIFGTPDKHYCLFKPEGGARFLPGHIRSFTAAYDLARKVAP